ncbi:MAG: hypothetical protein DI629_14470 [Mesorhizobium amorphae]|nr:MAG: hypothetical protein DI629_14470 [Mesorhizobium amorphae]
MRIVIAQRRLGNLGGSETFVLTIAEHLSRLGHEVVVFATDIGLAAEIAKQRAITVETAEHLLPDSADCTIALDRTLAVDMARLYPQAVRLYALHNSDDAWLPPAMPGIVHASLAPNDRLMQLAAGCEGAGEVVRIRQPIDLQRYCPMGWPRERPTEVLLFGNYHANSSDRIAALRDAWAGSDIRWSRFGGSAQTADVPEEMAKADIVVGYGRTILEAMACGRAAYVHDHSGSDGWVTAETYQRLEADGFAGTGLRLPPSATELQGDLAGYDARLGRIVQDLVRTHHDARLVAAQIVGIARRLRGGRPPDCDNYALRALRNLAENHLRNALTADAYRLQAKRHAEALRDEVERHARLHWQAPVFRRIAEANAIALDVSRGEAVADAGGCPSDPQLLDLIRGSGLFEASWYAKRYNTQKALEHYLRLGWQAGCDPHPLFHARWYLSENEDVRAAGVEPLSHFLTHGAQEGRCPNMLFEPAWYLETHPEVSSTGLNPLVHFIRIGAAKGFDPSRGFRTRWYVLQNEDGGLLGLDPLSHFFEIGALRGASPIGDHPRPA